MGAQLKKKEDEIEKLTIEIQMDFEEKVGSLDDNLSWTKSENMRLKHEVALLQSQVEWWVKKHKDTEERKRWEWMERARRKREIAENVRIKEEMRHRVEGE